MNYFLTRGSQQYKQLGIYFDCLMQNRANFKPFF
jgi:hypothetical protein